MAYTHDRYVTKARPPKLKRLSFSPNLAHFREYPRINIKFSHFA